ncbi:MAG: hypothetical protein A3F72_07310 [Bacteroidetes bacterium RIFCSPLOWO2_12_FULL_35_15]|nr:MAG: hypothetical protein A3F72_07310 [Bacteroidetes bacterium RIFCSPLOWO2_12_FULL_35_15]
MKYLFLLLLTAFSLLSSAQQKAKIGMTVNEVMKLYPNIKSDTVGNEITLSRTENLYGLNDTWGYRFKEEKLDWIFFHKYIKETTSSNFNDCLKATQKLIEDYTNAYGKPDTTLIGNTSFIDPYVKKHWGYDVLEVRWQNYNDMKIKIEFTFMGGKGEYYFLVQIHYFDKNYPYFD